MRPESVCGWQHHLRPGWMIWTFECCRGHASVIIGKHTHPLMHHQILGFYLAFLWLYCIRDISRNLGAYLNFTHCLFLRSWQWKKNFWNVSEISVTQSEQAVKKWWPRWKFHAVKKLIIAMKIFHTVKIFQSPWNLIHAVKIFHPMKTLLSLWRKSVHTE